MGNWLDNLVSSVKNLFSPPQQTASTPYVDPQHQAVMAQIAAEDKAQTIQNLANQAQIEKLQASVNATAAAHPEYAMLTNYLQNYQPPSSGQEAPLPGPSQYGANVQSVQPSRPIAYNAPSGTSDPTQSEAIASMLANLHRQNVPNISLPQTLSSTPYTNAASQIAGQRSALENVIMPYASGSNSNGINGGMLS